MTINLPKYFENLHIAVSRITGEPRIVSDSNAKTNFCEKYKNIDENEWVSALLNWFDIKSPKGKTRPTFKALMTNVEKGEGTFVYGGHFDSWENLELQAKLLYSQAQWYKKNYRKLVKENKNG
jgi:hypothetical protein